MKKLLFASYHSLIDPSSEAAISADDFEYQERAWGEDNFHAPEDGHVLWLENENRMRLKTTPQLNYDNPASKTVSQWFFSNYTTTVTGKKWQWNAVTETYVLPPTATFSTFSSAVGVYTLRVQVKRKNSSLVAEEIIHDDPYCFNRIQCVTWETLGDTTRNDDDSIGAIRLGNNPAANGGGKRCFPEQSTPDENSLHNELGVIVTLAVAIPQNQKGTVHLAYYDSNNPIGSTKIPDTNGRGKRDNHGTLSWETTTLEFKAGSRLEEKAVKISKAHAGDNYIVAAHPNDVAKKYEFKSDGKTLQRSTVSGQKVNLGIELQTPMLTVWRTLNVERDQVKKGKSDSSGWDYAGIPSLDGIPKSQFAVACISLVTYEQNEDSTDIDSSLWIVQENLTEADKQKVSDKRELPQPSPDFWTAHLVTTFWGGSYGNTTWHGWAPHDKIANTVFIFKNNIEGCAPHVADVLTQRTIAHELGHLMGLYHPSAPGLMAAKDDIGRNLTLDVILSSAHLKFTPDDIKIMQSMPKPT